MWDLFKALISQSISSFSLSPQLLWLVCCLPQLLSIASCSRNKYIYLPVNDFNKFSRASHFLGEFWVRQDKGKSFVLVFQGSTGQVKTNYYNSLSMRSFLLPLVLVLVPVPVPVPVPRGQAIIFKASTELENGGWDQGKLKCHKTCYCNQNPASFPWLSVSLYLSASSGCCKLLVSFQCSKRVDSASFCQLLTAFTEDRLLEFFTLPLSLMSLKYGLKEKLIKVVGLFMSKLAQVFPIKYRKRKCGESYSFRKCLHILQ